MGFAKRFSGGLDYFLGLAVLLMSFKVSQEFSGLGLSSRCAIGISSSLPALGPNHNDAFLCAFMNAAFARLLPRSTSPAKKKSRPGEKGKKKDTTPIMISATPINIRMNRVIAEALFVDVLKLADWTR